MSGDLEKTIKLMVKHKVLRLRVADVELELSPLAFVPALSDAQLNTKPDTSDICRCGHSYSVEHSDIGCLKGCSLAACAPEEE